MFKYKDFGLVSSKGELKILRELNKEEQPQALVIYKNDCVACKQTLKRLKLPIKPMLIDDDLISFLKSKGIRSMPYVVVSASFKAEDSWFGFRPDKIKQWNKGRVAGKYI